MTARQLIDAELAKLRKLAIKYLTMPYYYNGPNHEFLDFIDGVVEFRGIIINQGNSWPQHGHKPLTGPDGSELINDRAGVGPRYDHEGHH